MAAVTQVESLRALLRKEGLGAALPSAARKNYPPVPTGFAALDALLGGGVPRGQITELVGRASSGRTSVVFSLLAETTSRGEIAAYIDATDCFDPESAQQAGIALQRLLWVRGARKVAGKEQASAIVGTAGARHAVPNNGAPLSVHGSRFTAHDLQLTVHDPDARRLTPDTSSSWQAVNLVASAGGFGVIVLDLGGLSKRKLRPWQSRQWLRLRRAIEHSPTALVMVASEHLASTVSALVLTLSREKTQWEGTPGCRCYWKGFPQKSR